MQSYCNGNRKYEAMEGVSKEWCSNSAHGCGDCLLLFPESTDTNQLGEEIIMWSHETGKLFQVAQSINDLIA